MVATKPLSRSRGGPAWYASLLLVLTVGFLGFGFLNCSVDLSSNTPGASTLGACVAGPTAALTALQPVFDNFVKTSCAGCHGLTTGTARSGFATPDSSASGADSATQSFLYTQMCLIGGTKLGQKIDGTNTHSGGSFSRGGSGSALYNYLTTYLP